MKRAALLVGTGFLAGALITVIVLRRPSPPAPEPVQEIAAAEPAEATPEATAASRTAPAPAGTPAARPSRRGGAPAAGARETAPAPVEAATPAPVADVASLRVTSDVPGAQVFIDRQFIGAAPITAGNLKPGSHQVNVSAEGFEGIAQTIDLTPGTQSFSARFREVRLSARIPVIHKHRIGSCKGELVATPQGMRYETSDKDDAFTLALAEIETFEVDYKDKNLRVKAKKGRQFNFTDPEGNADKLFVFHRDVDKARDRLAKGDAAASN